MPSTRIAVRILSNKFVAGLIIIIPILITAQALWWLFSTVDGLARPLVAKLVGQEIPGIGFVSTVFVVLLTGILFSVGPLKWLLDNLDDLVEAIPLVGTVYGTIKKVLIGIGSPQARAAFKRFVLARLPGRTTPGFLTGTFDLRRADGTVETLCTVYIPTNHLYVGDIVILPAKDVIETQLSVEDGVSLVLSAGAAVPGTIDESRKAGITAGRAKTNV